MSPYSAIELGDPGELRFRFRGVEAVAGDGCVRATLEGTEPRGGWKTSLLLSRSQPRESGTESWDSSATKVPREGRILRWSQGRRVKCVQSAMLTISALPKGLQFGGPKAY